MRTFLALRHMGRVLCVTDQVPSSHSRGGEMKLVEERAGPYFLGERRVIGLDLGAGEEAGGASTTIVVPPGDSPEGRLAGAVSAMLEGISSYVC